MLLDPFVTLGIALLALAVAVILFFVLRNNIKSLKPPIDTAIPQLKEIDDAFQKFKESVISKVMGK